MPEILTRRQAIQQNLPRYFTGQPCKNGHIAVRYTRNGTCEFCAHPRIEAKLPPITPILERMRKCNMIMTEDGAELALALLLEVHRGVHPKFELRHLIQRETPWGTSEHPITGKPRMLYKFKTLPEFWEIIFPMFNENA
jgi:hypothetical protein